MSWLPICAASLLLLAAVSSSAAPTTVDVAHFGAMPDDGKDDTAAIAAAMREAAKTGAKKLVFHRGRYDLTAGGNPNNAQFLIARDGLKGLTIEGNGATLMVSGVTGTFGFGGCRDIAVRDFTIDTPRTPFSVGKVIAAEKRSFDVELPAEFPVQGGEKIGAFMDYDPVTKLPAVAGLDIYGAVTSTELLRPQVLRVRLSQDIPVPVGRLVVLRHEVYGHNAFEFHRCFNVHVSDITVYSTPGMGFVGIVCENVSLERFRVLNKPGTQRLMSATADGSHFGGCKGTVSLKDCVFEGMGDDGVNVKSGLYLTVKERVDDHTVLGQHNLKMADVPDAGDTMEMLHTSDLLTYASGKVVSAEIVPDTESVIRVRFADPLPSALKVGDVLGNASRAPKFRMSGCTVRRNRARGVLCQTRDAIIDNCTFQDNTSAGVLVMTEVVYFFESIGTRDVTVRNCRFKNCNYGAASAESALQAFAWLKDFAYPPSPGVHHRVTFEGNTIDGTDEAGIFAAGVDGLIVRGNTILHACRRPQRDIGKDAIHIQSSSGVEVEGNAIDPTKQGKGFRKAVEM